MKVTTRGKAILSASVALTFAALLYQDVIILTALLILAALTFGEAIWVWAVVRRPMRWFSLSSDETGAKPFSISKAIRPGENSHDELYFLKKIGGEVVLVSEMPFLKITPPSLKTRG